MMIRRHHDFMWSFTKTFLRSLVRPVIFYLVSLSLTIQTLFSVVFYVIEKVENPAIQTLFDSVYFTVTVTTGVGLGDISPVTFAGKCLAMLMMLAGTAIYVSFTAVLSVMMMEVELKHRA